jgi:hypothetical protein
VGCGCFVFCYGYSVGYSWFGYSVGYAVGHSVFYSYRDEYGSPDSDAPPDTNADSDIRRGSMPVVPDFRLSRSGADGELVALFGRFPSGVGDAD